MTAGLRTRWFAGAAAMESGPVRAGLAVTVLAGGVAAAWLTAGRLPVLAVLAVLLAAGNGYAKAYSP
jgi:hypothetical protein